ncbi:TetR/AcrR family transcriptional regulator [Streptomyces sp. CA-111067]|uniref:TetR/AcrR family transcriptional regulator n=1 Tax=Streptomyces sp. CA-111067 TaxID=3240046 RepID=UPI003D98EA03
MAKPGVPSKAGGGPSAASEQTRHSLVAAAIDVLRTDGYHGASARRIAERAGCNQGLVFYHFGSVANLLLAALDAVSADRLQRYTAAVAETSSVVGLTDVAAAIFEEDLDSGYAKVLVELIAGGSSAPGLGPEVAARIETWTGFAQTAVEDSVDPVMLAATAPAGELAYAIVAMYLGLEMLSHLDGDRDKARALFGRARQLTALATALGILPGAKGEDA